MSFGAIEKSRHQGAPVKLYLVRGADRPLESMIRSVTIIPGTTEFGYGTTIVRDNTGKRLNAVGGLSVTDFVASLDELIAAAPRLRHVSLVVAWHGTDLRCGECEIRPRVEPSGASSFQPYAWNVGGLTRAGAQTVSLDADLNPMVGGAPSDRTIYEAIREIKNRGLAVTLYPFILMDIRAETLPDPDGGLYAPAFPWRGRITCHPGVGQLNSPDQSADATAQVSAFFGSAGTGHFSWNESERRVNYSGPNEWRYRRFILHMATIAAAADADDFLIGSEMVGLTKVRSSTTGFPAVSRLIALAADARAILGSETRISYAADWSEYHSYRPNGDVIFNLDPLWADSNIDYIGIDNYMPLSDWRSASAHADLTDGWRSQYDISYLQSNIEGGEYYDWYYTSWAARNGQIRTPISDFYDEPWVWRQKDIRNWWLNEHRNRIDGARAANPTDWEPESKPVVFTEVGCAAIDKGANQPNVFYDAKSGESGTPYFSNGKSDPAMQRAFLEAFLGYWGRTRNNPASTVYNGRMIETSRTSIWTWDARPYPAFPERADYWGDAENWLRGHWLTGRIMPGRSFEAVAFGPFAFCDADVPVVRDGITYQPFPIKSGEITASATYEKTNLTVTMARGSDLDGTFVAYPPHHVVNLTIFEGHMVEGATMADFPAVWSGRVASCAYNSANEAELTCVPVASDLKTPGLRRNFQVGCPHVLYGEQCRADKRDATSIRAVAAIDGLKITFEDAVGTTERPASAYVGGLLEWSGGIATIARMSSDGLRATARGSLRGLDVGDTINVILGCNRRMSGCNMHGNILNFGGQPWIPYDNPLSTKNMFY